MRIYGKIAPMIDKNGYRLNVGIIITNEKGELFWGKRTKSQGWQFPQGGVNPYETLEETMYRELQEEVGLDKNDVRILGATKNWLNYKLPPHLQRRKQIPLCIGQKQKWFLLQMNCPDNKICFTSGNERPEFSKWRWVDYWYPLKRVVYFKRGIYRQVLTELKKCLPILK
jgi:putative (di)nucleoside polyphosphate hydrolase